MNNDREAKQSKVDSMIWMTVYKDGSGGFFSYENMVPVALNDMALTFFKRDLLNKEYDKLLFKYMKES